MNINKETIIPFIDFSITDKCNYNCEYCTQESRVENAKKSLAFNASDAIINDFMDVVKNLEGKWQIRLIGGEALLHPRFFELVEFIASTGHDVCLVTNFSFPIETYKKLIDICGDRLAILRASLHLSQIKSIDEFLNKAIEFNSYKYKETSFLVLSILTEANFEILKELKERFNTHNIEISFQRLKIHGELVSYNKEIEEYLEQNPEHVAKIIESLSNKNMFGTICNAGYNSYRIQTSGRVKRCFTEQGSLNFLGNIENKAFKLFNKPMPCLSKNCKCCIVPLNNNLIEINHKNYFKACYFYLKDKIGKVFRQIKKKLHFML